MVTERTKRVVTLSPPRPPVGKGEYDFRQTHSPSKPRISARVCPDGYEVYLADAHGGKKVVAVLPSWIDAYTLGRAMAEEG